MKIIAILCLVVSFFLCGCSGDKKVETLLNEWLGKEILYPRDTTFISWKEAAYPKSQVEYTVFVYTDSSGCLSCKLNLAGWERFVSLTEAIAPEKLQFLFVFQPNKLNELKMLLKSEGFSYPVFTDVKGKFDALNHFPSDMAFQTFLLDKDNKVLAIGNPVLNPKVKDLYLKIIQGKPVGEEEERERVETTVSVSSSILSMGEFPYREASSGSFTFTNTGKELWVIQDVVTSCGCLTVEYPKEPVRPGGQAVLRVTYRADHPGYFDKTLTVYSNAADSPLRLRVTGSAVE